MSSDISFAASDTSLTSVRNALASLHGKVALLERDRDEQSRAAAHARAEHDDYKARMEAELNRERLVAAERERQLLEDVAAAEAEIAQLKERLRNATLRPLPPRAARSDADVDLELNAAAQAERDRARVAEAEHEMAKLLAEREVLESANSQLDRTIQHLLSSNEELLQMLRVGPRAGAESPRGNPAAALGEVVHRHGGRGAGTAPPLAPGSAAAKRGTARSGSELSGLAQPPLRFRSPVHASAGAEPESSRRDTAASLARRTTGNKHVDAAVARLLQPPRSASRTRAASPPVTSGSAFGTSKNTARRYLTQELRSHATAAVPH
jgi:hypothetical protein